jgi:hypothetical protein
MCGNEDVFFAMPLAQTWHAIALFTTYDAICPLRLKKARCSVAPGQAFVCFDICTEKRDVSNLPPIDRGLLPFGFELRIERHFIPFFWTILKGAYAKKRNPPVYGHQLGTHEDFSKGEE